jgi:hypothetical protein
MKQLVIFPKGTLSAKDKERMSKDGYLAIETDDTSKVIMPMPSGALATADDITMALAHGLSGSYTDSQRAIFAAELFRRMREREANKKETL